MGASEKTNHIESTDKVTAEKGYYVTRSLRSSQPGARQLYYSL